MPTFWDAPHQPSQPLFPVAPTVPLGLCLCCVLCLSCPCVRTIVVSQGPSAPLTECQSLCGAPAALCSHQPLCSTPQNPSTPVLPSPCHGYYPAHSQKRAWWLSGGPSYRRCWMWAWGSIIMGNRWFFQSGMGWGEWVGSHLLDSSFLDRRLSFWEANMKGLLSIWRIVLHGWLV